MYIINQVPMESTCTDFWKMVHSRKCGVIVMTLTSMTSDLQKEGQVNKNLYVNDSWQKVRKY